MPNTELADDAANVAILRHWLEVDQGVTSIAKPLSDVAI